MKLSAFIKELQAIKKEHGDIKVNVFTDGGEGETEEPRFVFCVDEHDKVTEVDICDASWVDAFQ